jgi:hypothetical protein
VEGRERGHFQFRCTIPEFISGPEEYHEELRPKLETSISPRFITHLSAALTCPVSPTIIKSNYTKKDKTGWTYSTHRRDGREYACNILVGKPETKR